eukprot:144100_1
MSDKKMQHCLLAPLRFNRNTSLIVFGYIRALEYAFNLSLVIPKDVYRICCLFYKSHFDVPVDNATPFTMLFGIFQSRHALSVEGWKSLNNYAQCEYLQKDKIDTSTDLLEYVYDFSEIEPTTLSALKSEITKMLGAYSKMRSDTTCGHILEWSNELLVESVVNYFIQNTTASVGTYQQMWKFVGYFRIYCMNTNFEGRSMVYCPWGVHFVSFFIQMLCDEYGLNENMFSNVKRILKGWWEERFERIASSGQSFLKYSKVGKTIEPTEKLVRVLFDNNYEPLELLWGTGSRHIYFHDILYIARGHQTPYFQARKHELDPKLCFSVVGIVGSGSRKRIKTLDIQANNEGMVKLWVKGLRFMIGHSDEKSDELAKQYWESGDLPGYYKIWSINIDNRKQTVKLETIEKTKAMIHVQQNLFAATVTAVIKKLEEEKEYEIDQAVKERVQIERVRSLYELALRNDIPWRQWEKWVRLQIETYLREHRDRVP